MKMYGTCTQCAPNEQKCQAKIIDEKDYVLWGVLCYYPAFLLGCLEIRAIAGGAGGERAMSSVKGRESHTAFKSF